MLGNGGSVTWVFACFCCCCGGGMNRAVCWGCVFVLFFFSWVVAERESDFCCWDSFGGGFLWCFPHLLC